MAMKVRIQPIVNVMRQDVKYKRLKSTFATHENFRLPLESLMDELKLAHSQRSVRTLNPTDPRFVDNVIEANLKDQAVRSRTTEIIIRCVRAHTLLANSVESLKYHLLISYSNDLKSFRTVAERAQIVNMTLKRFDTFLTDVMVLKDSAQLVVNDIDKASWALKSVLQAMELHHSPERRL
jgi:hypothetical protein